MLAQNGAGPAPCVDRGEAGKIVGTDGRQQSSKLAQSATQAARAELIGSTACTAAGITGTGHAPVLSLCRQLLAAGLDPDTALEVFRGATLALHVRSIGKAAGLTVKDDNRGVPRFGSYRPGPDER